MLKRIGAEESGEFKAVASGTLPSGKPVVVNSDGTVSVVAESSDSAGSPVVYSTGNAQVNRAAFDSSNNKVVFVYQDGANSSYGTVVIGTVSGNSISFGTPVVFASATTYYPSVAFDSSNNKIVVAAGEASGGEGYNAGRARVGTVSGTSISFGTGVVFNAANTVWTDTVYDSGNGKIVIIYKDQGNSNYGTSVVGTVSGTSISFGSEVVWQSANLSYPRLSYDTNAGKVVLVYRDNANSSYGTALVGTVSGTSISFGSEVVFHSGTTLWIDITYDSTAQKHVIVYNDSSDTYGKARVGTVSGTSISFGTEVTFESAESQYMSTTYDSNANKTVVMFKDGGNSNKGTAIIGTVSGTNISFGTPFIFADNESFNIDSTFDSNSNKVVTCFQNSNDTDNGTSSVINVGSPNLTSENYIGMSRGVVNSSSATEAVGSETVFESANTSIIASVYDSNENKTAIFYKDQGNSNYGTAIIGTVSGTSISYGSPVVFYDATANYIDAAFDSNSNKIVVVYNVSGTNHGAAIVGTVSGTSISFGSPVVYNAATTAYTSVVFDSNSNKVVIAYQDGGNSNHGTAIVGTVSGTSISFGSETVFESATTAYISTTFDSNSNKVVIGYQDVQNSDHGTAIVGTVSGTSISFGSATVFESAAAAYIQTGFDSTNNKVVIAYQDFDNSYYGTAVVGTVSGTSISFGTPVVFQSSQANTYGVAHDSNAQKNVIFFRDQTSTAKGTVIVGTVSGTSISFNTKTAVNDGYAGGHTHNAIFDSTAQKVVITYKDDGNNGYGTAVVYQTAFDNTFRGEVANSGNASIDIIGSVSDNQLNLTAGQQYFVQTDGTISETAGDPSVLAGTAISATELLVKT